jgi:hypothetical protein
LSVMHMSYHMSRKLLEKLPSRVSGTDRRFRSASGAQCDSAAVLGKEIFCD